MSFNKWFPDRPEAPAQGVTPELRGILLRAAWWVSMLMMVGGYVLAAIWWNA